MDSRCEIAEPIHESQNGEVFCFQRTDHWIASKRLAVLKYVVNDVYQGCKRADDDYGQHKQEEVRDSLCQSVAQHCEEDIVMRSSVRNCKDEGVLEKAVHTYAVLK